MPTFEGAFTALVTPFKDDAVDEPALRDLVERQIAGGIDGLVPCGTTGESVTLRGDEPARVIRVVVEQAKGRVPVIAGTGTNATHRTIELSKIGRDAGADGLLLVCPYYNKPGQRGIEAHFRAVLEEVPLPSILYNIPGRTGVDIEADTIGRLLDIDAVVGVKEATGNILKAQELCLRFGDRLSVLSGDDALTLGMMACGAKGVISVTSNLLPAEVAAVVHAAASGDFATAKMRHQRLVAVHVAMFIETNPGPVKGAMAARDRLAPEVRLPITWPSAESLATLEAALSHAGLGL